MKLSLLLQGIEHEVLSGSADMEIHDVWSDSRRAGKDDLFVACYGIKSDGHDYIDKAVSNGAGAILIDKKRADEFLPLYKDLTVVGTADTAYALAHVYANLNGNPAENIRFAGVTGTKGKTTTTFMIRNILRKAGIKSGLIGTVCNYNGDIKVMTHHTTPEPRDIQSFLADLCAGGATDCVMEVSSLGLKQARVEGIRFDAACFTNLYRDHISPDEHPDMEDYLRSKLMLFDCSDKALIDIDTDECDRILEAARSKCKVWTCSLHKKADITCRDMRYVEEDGRVGMEFTAVTPEFTSEMFIPLSGEFNVSNALCAIGVSMLLGIGVEHIKEGLASVFVPGRMQPVKNSLGINVVVDYAHNAAGLQNVLETINSIKKGRVITVFGCGGQRSRDRRFQMGEVSGDLSDITVITSDNPRAEDPNSIISDIIVGMEKTDGEYSVEPDRTAAIRMAIRMARPNDYVLIAGKGHEDYQEFEDGRRIHFDDVETAAAILAEEEGKK